MLCLGIQYTFMHINQFLQLDFICIIFLCFSADVSFLNMSYLLMIYKSKVWFRPGFAFPCLRAPVGLGVVTSLITFFCRCDLKWELPFNHVQVFEYKVSLVDLISFQVFVCFYLKQTWQTRLAHLVVLFSVILENNNHDIQSELSLEYIC